MTRPQQTWLLASIVLSLPIYFAALEFPVVIVNEGILGEAFHQSDTARLFEISLPLPQAWGGTLHLSEGIELDQLSFLLVSCATFFALILVNSGFKYLIELQKGRISTLVNERLQEDMTARLLASNPEAAQRLKPGEIATALQADLEPIGEFAGSAFGTPMVQAGHAAVALFFISLQSVLLGVLAAVMLAIQFWIVPRLGHHEVHLQAARRSVGRAVAGRIGELAEAMPLVRAEGVARYEVTRMRGEYRRYAGITSEALRWGAITHASMVTFAQLSRLAMFVAGGLLTFASYILVGNLVAVLNAFRELPESVEQLLTWHHKLHDAQERFDRLPGLFGPSAPALPDTPQPADLASGRLKAKAVRLETARGQALIERLDLDVDLPAHVALVDHGGDAAAGFAAILGGEAGHYEGRVRLASTPLDELSPDLLGRQLGYVGPASVIFDASLRDNVTYSLNRRVPTGPGDDDWTDYALAGVDGPAALDERIIALLQAFGLGPDLYAAGLGSPLARAPDAELSRKLVAARQQLRGALDAAGLSELVEPFDGDAFLENGTLFENILFGCADAGASLGTGTLLADAGFAGMLRETGLDRRLVACGRNIALQLFEMYETGSGEVIPAGHSLLLPERDVPRVKLAIEQGDDRALLAIAFDYCEPRHRLGLVDDDLRQAVLAARRRCAKALSPALRRRIHGYDREAFCAPAPLRDNLLFGRVVRRIAGAGPRVDMLLAQALADLGLMPELYRAALDLPAGPGGRFLTRPQRSILALARALAKRPSALVVNIELGQFPAPRRAELLAQLRREMAGRTLLVALKDGSDADGFDVKVHFDGPRLQTAEADGSAPVMLDLAG